MKLLGKTNNIIRKLAGYRNIEVPEREGHLNELLAGDSAVTDWWPLVAGLEVEDVGGLIELDLYLYTHAHALVGNLTVWVFEEKKGVQHVYLDRAQVPSEFERAVRRATK